MLFHLTQNLIKDNILIPKIPKYAISPYEDTTTKRICVSHSIEKCLSAFPSIEVGSLYYVCTPISKNHKVYSPSISQVFDADYTGEKWITERVKIKILGVIEVTGWMAKYHGNQICSCFLNPSCSYKWVEKYTY